MIEAKQFKIKNLAFQHCTFCGIVFPVFAFIDPFFLVWYVNTYQYMCFAWSHYFVSKTLKFIKNKICRDGFQLRTLKNMPYAVNWHIRVIKLRIFDACHFLMLLSLDPHFPLFQERLASTIFMQPFLCSVHAAKYTYIQLKYTYMCLRVQVFDDSGSKPHVCQSITRVYAY